LTIDPVSGLSSVAIRDTSDHLCLALALASRRPKGRPKPKILILLTKSDLLPASARQATLPRAKLSLEREMEKRRVLTGRSLGGARLQSLPGGGSDEDEGEIVRSSDIFAGEGPWTFERSGFQLDWAMCSAKSSEGLTEIWSWADGL